MAKTKMECKTVTNKDFKSYPEKGKEKTMNCVTRTDRKDHWVQRHLMIEHFKNIKR